VGFDVATGVTLQLPLTRRLGLLLEPQLGYAWRPAYRYVFGETTRSELDGAWMALGRLAVDFLW